MKKILIFLILFISIVFINLDIKNMGDGDVQVSMKEKGTIIKFVSEAMNGNVNKKINAQNEIIKLAGKEIDFEKLYFREEEIENRTIYKWSNYDINKYIEIKEKLDMEDDEEKLEVYKRLYDEMLVDYLKRIEYKVEIKEDNIIENITINNNKRETYESESQRAYYEVNLKLKEIAKKEINKFAGYEVDTTTLDEEIKYYKDDCIVFTWKNRRTSLNKNRKLKFVVGFELKDLKDLSKVNGTSLEYELIYLNKYDLDKDFEYKDEYLDFDKNKAFKIAREFLKSTDYIDSSNLRFREYKDSETNKICFWVEFIYSDHKDGIPKDIRVFMDKHFYTPIGFYKH